EQVHRVVARRLLRTEAYGLLQRLQGGLCGNSRKLTARGWEVPDALTPSRRLGPRGQQAALRRRDLEQQQLSRTTVVCAGAAGHVEQDRGPGALRSEAGSGKQEEKQRSGDAQRKRDGNDSSTPATRRCRRTQRSREDPFALGSAQTAPRQHLIELVVA